MAKETKYVVPKGGLLIRFPKQPKIVLPVTGAIVPWIGSDGRFWRRRNADGSIDVYEDRESFNKKNSGPAVIKSPIRERENKTGGNK